MLHISLLVMNRLNKIEFAICIPLAWSLLRKNLLIRTYLPSLQLVLCRLAAVKRLLVHHHSEIIFSGHLGLLNSFLVIIISHEQTL